MAQPFLWNHHFQLHWMVYHECVYPCSNILMAWCTWCVLSFQSVSFKLCCILTSSLVALGSIGRAHLSIGPRFWIGEPSDKLPALDSASDPSLPPVIITSSLRSVSALSLSLLFFFGRSRSSLHFCLILGVNFVQWRTELPSCARCCLNQLIPLELLWPQSRHFNLFLSLGVLDQIAFPIPIQYHLIFLLRWTLGSLWFSPTAIGACTAGGTTAAWLCLSHPMKIAE